ncbi:MAG TPA: hypothetical protein VK523_00430 [Steroidobacteraceae bacterium]|nr:hypothetical protein [Steroidobacteraceae bacterium]
MKRVWLGILLISIAIDAQAVGSVADIQIIDRDTGNVLPTHRYRGEYWVAGTPGARYSIRVQNHRGQRLLAVTAVDGVNVISGETGAWGQSGYVLGAGEGYEITGWRKSDAEIAAFNFTSAGRSYAQRTGRPANIGVIGVALFLERPAQVSQYVQPPDQKSEESSRDRSEGAARAAPQSPVASSLSSPKLAGAQSLSNMAPAEKLGTGHGTREASYVQNTQFDRLSSTPNEIIKIRYDSFENLVAMGVVASRPAWRPGPNPFPDSSSPRYVPDPPGG